MNMEGDAQTVHAVFGERLRNIRKKLKLPQSAIGNLFAMKQGNVSEIERGSMRFTVDRAFLLCQEYRVNPSYLLKGESPMFLKEDQANPSKRITMRRLKEIMLEADTEIPSILKSLLMETIDEVLVLNEEMGEKDRQIVELEKELAILSRQKEV